MLHGSPQCQQGALCNRRTSLASAAGCQRFQYAVDMTWFTYVTGLVIFLMGVGCRFLIPLAEWQALVPVVLGLGFLTMAEGMRSTKKHRRLFQFLSILWSAFVLVAMIPLAKEGMALMNQNGAPVDPRGMRPELVMEHAGVLAVSAVYLLVAVLVFFRPAKTAASTPLSEPTPPSTGR